MSATHRIALPTLLACLAGCATGSVPRDTVTPRVSETRTILFDGGTFTQLFVTRRDGDLLREYYQAGETPDKWTRFVELRIYSGTAQGMTPAAFVKDMDRRLKQRDPKARSDMRLDPDGSASYAFGTHTGDDALAGASEFSAFKFSTDAHSGALVAFHYVERFPGNTDDRNDRDALLRLTQIEARIKPEIEAVPGYQE